jgi:hypothetical protein
VQSITRSNISVNTKGNILLNYFSEVVYFSHPEASGWFSSLRVGVLAAGEDRQTLPGGLVLSAQGGQIRRKAKRMSPVRRALMEKLKYLTPAPGRPGAT